MNSASVQRKKSTRIAILVIHGVGQQMRFDTLSGFAASLKTSLLTLNPNASCEIRRDLIDANGIDSLLRISCDDTQIDVIEYYYQPKLQRQVSREDVIDWLANTAKRVKRIYNFKLLSGKAPDERYLLSRVSLFAKFLLLLINLSKFLELTGFTSPLANLLKRFVFSRLDSVLTDFVGDVVAYTAIDPKLRLNEVREDILFGCVDKIKSLLTNEDKEKKELTYDHVLVAGHSLGSVVGYDALSKINRELQNSATNLPGGNERLSGLVTFGSPLDKIAMFFWPLPEEKEKISERFGVEADRKSKWLDEKNALYAGLLTHFHGLRGLENIMDGKTLSVIQPQSNPLDHVVWLNFFHPEDLIAGHLDAYKKLTNIKTSAEITGPDASDHYGGAYTPSFPEAHSYYWYDPKMMEIIIKTFLHNNIIDVIKRGDIGDYLEGVLKSLDNSK